MGTCLTFKGLPFCAQPVSSYAVAMVQFDPDLCLEL